MTRTTRESGPFNVGWSSGPPDDTDDKWNDLMVLVHSIGGAATFEFKHFSDDRRLLNRYTFVVDDEAFLVDLAAACLGAIAGIQHYEDSRERIKASQALEPDSLDSPQDVEAKHTARRELYNKKRKKAKRRKHDTQVDAR